MLKERSVSVSSHLLIQQAEGLWFDPCPLQSVFQSVLGQNTAPPNCPWRLKPCFRAAYLVDSATTVWICVCQWVNGMCCVKALWGYWRSTKSIYHAGRGRGEAELQNEFVTGHPLWLKLVLSHLKALWDATAAVWLDSCGCQCMGSWTSSNHT